MDTTTDKPAVQLKATALAGALTEFACAAYCIHLGRIRGGSDVTYADIFRPDFWTNVTKKLRPLDTVRLIAADWAWDVTVTCEHVTEAGAVVRLLNNRGPMSPAETDAIIAKHAADGDLARAAAVTGGKP